MVQPVIHMLLHEKIGMWQLQSPQAHLGITSNADPAHFCDVQMQRSTAGKHQSHQVHEGYTLHSSITMWCVIASHVKPYSNTLGKRPAGPVWAWASGAGHTACWKLKEEPTPFGGFSIL